MSAGACCTLGRRRWRFSWCALSPALIRFSSEVKQYETDAAASIAVIDVGVALVQSGLARLSIRRALFSGVVVGLCALVSHTAVFATIGLAIALAMSLRDFTRRTVLGILLGGAVIGAAVLVQYRVTIEPLRKNFVFLLAWRENYPPLFKSWPTRLSWLPSGLERFARDPFHSGPGLLVLAILLVGAIACWRRCRQAAVLLVAPLGVNIGTALTYHYPLGDRLAVYYLPCGAVLAAAAADPVLSIARVPRLAGRTREVLCTLAILVLAATQIPGAVRLTRHPQIVTELSPVMRSVRAGMTPSERVFPYWESAPAYVYYARRFGLPTTSMSIGDLVLGLSGRRRPAGRPGRRPVLVRLRHHRCLGGGGRAAGRDTRHHRGRQPGAEAARCLCRPRHPDQRAQCRRGRIPPHRGGPAGRSRRDELPWRGGPAADRLRAAVRAGNQTSQADRRASRLSDRPERCHPAPAVPCPACDDPRIGSG